MFTFLTAEAALVTKQTMKSNGLNRAQDLSKVNKFEGGIFVKTFE